MPPVEVEWQPSTGGANTITTNNVISYDTRPDGSRVPLGGVAVGGWSFPTGPEPAVTTAWEPVGPVATIDPFAVAERLRQELGFPEVRLRANPDPGVVAVPSWFWVEGYDGRPRSRSDTVSETHTECRLNAGAVECQDVTTSITVELRMEPRHYTWDYGDGRPGSRRVFESDDGLGRRYTDPRSPSPVAWAYEFSSFGRPNGFPLTLVATWSVAFRVDGGSWQTLPDASQTYTAEHIVEQVQPLRLQPRAAAAP